MTISKRNQYLEIFDGGRTRKPSPVVRNLRCSTWNDYGLKISFLQWFDLGAASDLCLTDRALEQLLH